MWQDSPLVQEVRCSIVIAVIGLWGSPWAAAYNELLVPGVEKDNNLLTYATCTILGSYIIITPAVA